MNQARTDLINELISHGLLYRSYRQVVIRPVDLAALTKEDQELLQSNDGVQLTISETNLNLG